MVVVYSLGSNGSGQLGIGHEEDVSVPKPVYFADSPPASIRAIAAGGNHTLILSDAGELYWAGDPTSGACPIRPALFMRLQKHALLPTVLYITSGRARSHAQKPEVAVKYLHFVGTLFLLLVDRCLYC